MQSLVQIRTCLFRKGRSSHNLGAFSFSCPLSSQFSTNTDVLSLFVQKCTFTSTKLSPNPKLNSQLNLANMNGFKGKKETPKSGPKPSTSNSGKSVPFKPESKDLAKSQLDSSVEFLDDDDEDFLPPKSWAKKGSRASKKANRRMKASDFFHDAPVTRSQTLDKVVIKTEPVSPERENVPSWIKDRFDDSDSHQNLAAPKSIIFPSGSASAGGTSRSSSGSQPAAKTPPEDTSSSAATSFSPSSQPPPNEKPANDSGVDTFNSSGQGETSRNDGRDASPTPRGPPSLTSTPLKTSAAAASPRRSPRLKKDYNSSPGKRNIENQLASRKGLARKKAAQLPTVAESDPNGGSEVGSGFVPDIFDQVESEAENQPHRRPPFHEGRKTGAMAVGQEPRVHLRMST